MKKLILAMIMAIAFVAFAYPAMSATSATAQQGQLQGQGQSQSQAAYSGVANSGNSAVVFENAFNGSQPIRSLPLPSAVNVDMRGGPAMFARPEPDKGANFISARDLVQILNAVKIGNAEYDDEEIEANVQMLNNEAQPATDSEASVKFSLVGNGGVYPAGFHPIAICTFKAEGPVTSATIAAALAHKARTLGATKIVFIREGVHRKLESTGYGIGLSYNYATVGSGQSGFGGVGAGGTGWSHGSAEYLSMPYLTAAIGN